MGSDDRLKYEAEDLQFIENLKLRREAKGWSQTDFARKMQEAGWSSYSQMTVSRTEKAERQIPVAEARSIAKILDTSMVLMFKPPETLVLIEDLADLVGTVRSLQRGIQHYIFQIAVKRDLARYTLERYEEQVEALPEDLREIAARTAEQLRDLLAKPINDLIGEALDVNMNADDGEYSEAP